MPTRGAGRGPAGRGARRPGPARASSRQSARQPARPRAASHPVERARPAAAAERPTPLWRGLLPDAAGSRRIFRAGVLASILAFLAVLLVPTVRAYLGQRSEINSLRDQVAAQQRSVAGLQAEKRRWQDPAYVEQQARARLKFVKPGETSYTVIDATPKEADVPVLHAATGVPDDLPWYGTVWSSMGAADAPGTQAP